MHYYQFNIGDYAKSTLHLSPLEDLAYRRLLDRYYDTEKPLEADITKLCRFIRMGSYEKETQQILDEYFSITQKGWIQKRVQKELGAYSAKADAARANGKLGGRPKKTQSVILANPELTHEKAKQEPLTINQEPRTKNQSSKNKDHSANESCLTKKDQDFEKLWNSFDINHGTKGSKQNAKKQYFKQYKSIPAIDDLISSVKKQIEFRVSSQSTGTFVENLQHVERWLRNSRWEDEITNSQNPEAWHTTASGIKRKAIELGLNQGSDEQFHEFKQRVFLQSGDII